MPTIVTPITQWSPDRHIIHSGTRVILRFDREAASRATELYGALAQLCIRCRASRLMIVAEDDGGAGEHALRNALTTMILAGIAPAFRLALVAPSERGQWRYRTLQRDLCAAHLYTRIFASTEEGLGWLDQAPERASA